MKLLLTAILASLSPGPLGLASPGPVCPTVAASQDQKGGDEKKSPRELEKEREAAAKEAVRALGEGLRSKLAPERVAALTDAAKVDHPKVVAAIATALQDKDPKVSRTAIELLGGMADPSALAALKNYARRSRKLLAKDPSRMALILRSVAFHGDPDSVDWLLGDPFAPEDRIVREARLFSVARMRSKEGLDAIFAAMAKTDHRILNSRMRELRVTLIWLTSKDLGADPVVWNEWWRKNRRDFEIPKSPPKLTGRDYRDWKTFWGEEYTRPQQKKRGDRG